MTEVQRESEDLEFGVSSVEAEAKEAVKGEIEGALGEGVDALKEMLDEMEDELVPPLDMVVPFLAKAASECAPEFIQQCWQWLERQLANAPALLHLVTMEFLPMWFFMFSVRSVFHANLTHALGIGEDGEDNDDFMQRMLKQHGANSFPTWEKKLEECSAKQIQYQIDFLQCIDRHFCAEGKDEARVCNGGDLAIMSITSGAYLLVLAIMIYVLISFVRRGLVYNRLSHGSYLKFCLDIKRTVVYRYIAGVLTVCAALGLLFIFAHVISSNILGWFIQDALLAVLITSMSMRSFTRAYRPRFATMDAAEGKFSDLLFRRQFFEGSGGFSSRLSSALLQASRLPRAPVLRKMLWVELQDENEMARRVRQVRQVCQRKAA